MDPPEDRDAGPAPPVEVNSQAHKILAGEFQLLGWHLSGCSYGPASSAADAEVWCAAARPGGDAESLELWVVNPRRLAAEGGACPPANGQVDDGAGTGCLRLTTRLLGAGPERDIGDPTLHRFYGDTLIYYADARSGPFDSFEGPIYAWRPGWPAGRRLTGERGAHCVAHDNVEVATCIENVSAADVVPFHMDLHAGPIGERPLPRVAQIFPIHPDTGATQWSSGFSPDGQHLAYSTAAPSASDPETLFQVRFDEAGRTTPTRVAEPGLSQWALSPDGARVYFLRDFNYDEEGLPSGTLAFAPFPGPGTEVRLAGSLVPSGARDGVALFQVLTDAERRDRGLGVVADLDQGKGSYRVIKDPAGSADDPANVVVAGDPIASLPVHAPDQRFFFFSRERDGFFGTGDAWIARADGGPTCALSENLEAALFGTAFTRAADLVFWTDRINVFTDSGEGWVASPDGCAGKRKFSDSIDFWFIDDQRGLLYSDDSDGTLVTLRQADVRAGQLAPATLLQRSVERLYSVYPGHRALLFSLQTGASSDGIYFLDLAAAKAP